MRKRQREAARSHALRYTTQCTSQHERVCVRARPTSLLQPGSRPGCYRWSPAGSTPPSQGMKRGRLGAGRGGPVIALGRGGIHSTLRHAGPALALRSAPPRPAMAPPRQQHSLPRAGGAEPPRPAGPTPLCRRHYIDRRGGRGEAGEAGGAVHTASAASQHSGRGPPNTVPPGLRRMSRRPGAAGRTSGMRSNPRDEAAKPPRAD